MRLKYVADPPEGFSAEELAILERVKARRGELGLLPLDLTLLIAPQVADGWNTMLGAIRTRSSLPEDIREIAICRTAVLNRAWFEWNAHYPHLEKCEGITEEHLSVVRERNPTSRGALSAQQWAVLQYSDTMTLKVEVPQSLFDQVKNSGLTDKQMVELTATVATYNLVGRFLVALDVGEQNGKTPAGMAGKS